MIEAGQVAAEPPNESNVIQLFDPERKPQRDNRATPEELEDFRKHWPAMKQLLREWERVTSQGGCPVARQITGKS